MIAELIFGYVFDKRFLLQLFVSNLTFVAIQICIHLVVRSKRYRLFDYYGIPGPKPNLLEGNFTEIKSYPLYSLADKKFNETYGKVYRSFVGDEPSVTITDLEILRKLFLYETRSFRARSEIFIDSPLSQGLFFAKYHRWRVMRKIMLPSFNRYTTRANSSTEQIDESISLMLNYLDYKCSEAKAKGEGFLLDVQALMRSTALHLISAMAIGLPDVKVQEDNPYVENLNNFMEQADSGAALWAMRVPWIKSLLGFIANNFEYDIILSLVRKSLNQIIDDGAIKYKSRKSCQENKSDRIIDMLVKMYYQGKLSRREVIGNAETILIAGYDTTSTTLTYVFWILAKNPEMQERLRDELMAYNTESGYLHQILSETMRLYPTLPTFTTRLATSTVEVDDLTIPQGTLVVHNSYLMHRSPEFWDDPLKFDPERFRKGTNHHTCAYAPFGMGDRRCLGYRLAMLEMKMIICDLILRYKLILVKPAEMELKTHGVVLSAPMEKVILKLEKIR